MTYAVLVLLLSVVSDGWSGKPSPLLHQLILLPFDFSIGFGVWRLLAVEDKGSDVASLRRQLPAFWWVWLVVSELLSVLMMIAEAHHFASFGYRLLPVPCAVVIAGGLAGWVPFALTRRSTALFPAVVTTYAAGSAFAIQCFPLNYLRSDMLPVIQWADDRFVRHLDPYQTMHVGTRLYDFPYLPGMLVAFWPAAVLRSDLRLATLSYLLATSLLIFLPAKRSRRFEVAASLGLFLLCPFLQYRHDLYLEPHWFCLALGVVLMSRGRLGLSAFVWGVSCGIYQLSWILVPFFLLYSFRRNGFWELGKVLGLLLLGAMAVVGPFLRSATRQIASNTVGQWSHLPHALADPVNVSYWVSYAIRPDQLKWVQLGVLTGFFAYCYAARRCTTVVDTVRWMACALAVFIPLNVLVDGYFYLTLLLVLLLYLCLVNQWWFTPREESV